MVSYVFILTMIVFLCLLFAELHVGGGEVSIAPDDLTMSNDYHVVTAFSIIVFAYNIQFLVFPAYTELRNRSNFRFAQASIQSILIETFMYVAIGMMAILMFGPDEVKPDILENMALRSGAISLSIRGIFCLVLILDIPFIFFATKEQSLVLHDEIVNQSFSRLTDKALSESKLKEDPSY